MDDLKLEGQAYMGLVRSPYAHATIKNIDFTKVRSSPDFVAALTGDDLLKAGVPRFRRISGHPRNLQSDYHLAVGKVRFMGEPVAAVVARHKNSLEDLVEQVEVDYDPTARGTNDRRVKEGKYAHLRRLER